MQTWIGWRVRRATYTHTVTNLFLEAACELSVQICSTNDQLATRIKIIVRIEISLKK